MLQEELLHRPKAVQHLATGKRLEGVTTIRSEQQELFDGVGEEKPTAKRLGNGVKRQSPNRCAPPSGTYALNCRT